jgi:hypothetical protein
MVIEPWLAALGRELVHALENEKGRPAGVTQGVMRGWFLIF